MDDQNPTQTPPVSPATPAKTPVVEIVPPQAEPQQAPPSGKFSFSPKIILAILLLLIVVVVGGGIYLAQSSKPKETAKSNPTPTSKPSPTPDPTADWKTYENNIFKYSLKYPDSLTHSPLKYEGEGGTIFTDSWKSSNNSYSINIYSYPDIYASASQPEFNAKTISDENIIVSGQNVKKLTGKEIISDIGTLIHIGPLKNNSQNYYIIFSSGSSIATQESLDIFNKLAFTFKFTDASPSPTCIPRPACLDATPRCLIPETPDMCPSTITSTP
ncbi:MAG: hypothetical protein AAB531_02180 [Patescibacteria group bacterium]